VWNFDATGATPGRSYDGFYFRAEAETPILDYSCMLRVSIGGAFALWYWDDQGSSDVYKGAHLTAYAFGEAACLVSVRGQIELDISFKNADMYLEGEVWVAGGAGFCEPEDWHTWYDVWEDNWCATVGARGTATYDTESGDWSLGYELRGPE
jgi:hypothetical protein